MNEINHRGADNHFPGCTGRVVNFLDFGPRMTANRLLSDKPHSDDLVNKRVDHSKDLLEEKTMPYEMRRSPSRKKSNGTPMKMLIAHEMSKEADSKQKPPNLVAKLMGLDSLPEQKPNLNSQRGQKKSQVQNSLSRPDTPPRYMQHEGSHQLQDQKEYKDVYEVWQQSPVASYIENKSLDRGRYSEKPKERGMDLVRQKFTEAKRLATDENLRQSKEFQEALEVLSSNKELFLKFLQEPNSLFSQHMYELKTVPSVPHTKRITVLRPSKSMGNDQFIGYDEVNEKSTQKESPPVEANLWDKSKGRRSSSPNQMNDNFPHPTRIVVLKPSPGKTHDVRTVASSPSLSPRQLHGEDYYEELDDDEVQCSREVAKEITQKMRETLTSYPREDTMLSSVFSNGYVGDESSFNKSDNEYVGEGNLSDSEIMTPTSRVSWDYVNKFGSPFSSSFSRASYSPESSVCREAKKRLSERWAMMASNGNGEEQRQVRRSSSTLGEMLALPETKKLAISSVEKVDAVSVSTSRSFGGEQELRGETPCFSGSDKKDEAGLDSPKNFLRSRSVPVSSTAYGSRLNVEVHNLENNRSNIPNEVQKSKSVKSSFRGKVSSLFFSRNKKQNKDKSIASPSSVSQDNLHSSITETLGELEQLPAANIPDDIPQCVTSCDQTAVLLSACAEQKQGDLSPEGVFSIARPEKARSPGENSEQPSPVSVLEAPFEDEDTTPQTTVSVKTDLQGLLARDRSPKSNLIAKSPPIESLARSLSWEDASDLATPALPNYSVIPSEANEEQEWLLFIQKLLSSAGMNNGELSDACFARWHSPECPLNPKLLEKYLSLKEGTFHWHDAKFRQQRSKQKLIFDSVNQALVDITRYKSNTSLWRQCSSFVQSDVNSNSVNVITAEEVWNRMKEWFSSDTKCYSDECEDNNNNLVVDRVVRKEVVGRGWVENMRLEMEGIGKEIEVKVLEELVEDALFELTGRFH